jgi:hypothetical protein
MLRYFNKMVAIIVAVQCKAPNAFVNSNTGIVGLNPIRSMFSVLVLFCV